MFEEDKLINFGLINIDKPVGPTSYSISDYVRRKLGLKKTSHMGTLDPKVTGVLPITLGRACKLASYFIKHDKTYAGILHTHKEHEISKIQEVINENFVGKIKQTPPNRSAVKRAERERTVYYWNLLESDDKGKSFLFETKVEGGTYIRKICSDLGDLIGGAHMSELRRTQAGIFGEDKIYSLMDLDLAIEEYKKGNPKILKKMIVPAEGAIKNVLKVVIVDKRVVKSLHTGKPLFKRDILELPKLGLGEDFAVFCGKKFIGVYKQIGHEEIFGRPEFVYN